MEDYRAQITEVYEGPRVMPDVRCPTGQMAYQKKVVYEDDVYGSCRHQRHNPEQVRMTEVERIVEKPRHGYGEVIYEDMEAARYAQLRPTGYGTRHFY